MPLDSVVAADLLARLLTDDRFRAEFRSDPVGTCRGMDLDDVADELERESARAFQTLEIRESRSSLAGVLLAAAAEGVGVAELVQTMRAGDGDRWQAAAALSRAMPAVHDAGLPVDVPDEGGDTPTCPLCLLREPGAPAAHTKCSGCGEPGPLGSVLCPTCMAERAAAAPAAGVAAPVPTGPPPPMPPAVGTPPPPVQAGAVPNGSPAPEPGGQAATPPPAPALQEVRAPADPEPAAARAAFAAPAPGPAGPDAPGSAGRASAVFGVVPAPGSRTPEAAPGAVALQARPAVVPAPALAEVAPVPAAGAAPGAPTVAPIDPSQLNNTNAGGKLHGSEFNVRDAEGAPGPSGNLHAGYDFFAKENAPIRSPISGTVVEVRASRGTSGQIFGGTVKVQGGDGRVWVFRHVTPGSVSVGQKIEAGTQIAVVSPWTDGPEHTHIELWKTLEGGYNVPNMEDPLPHLKALYSGNGASLPANGASSPAGVAQAVPVPSAPVAGAPVAAAVSPADLIEHPNVVAVPAVAAELASADLDPRVVSMLSQLSDRYKIGLTSVETDGDLSRVIIGSVNGRPVGPSNIDARDLAQELAGLDPSARPSEVGTPWQIKGKGFFTEPALRNRLEVGYRASDAPIGALTTPPVQPAPSATPGADAAADAAASLPADDAALAAQLDAWMARKNPGAPLQGYGAVFVREGRANGVDPRLLVAIARAESSLGSDPGAISINNAFGWGPHKPFPTWDENIATVAKGLRTGYIDDGLDTINEIQKRYCPVGAANDPTGVNSNWLGNVRLLYAELGGDPDGSVALAPSGQVGPPAVEPLVAQPQVLASPVQVQSAVTPPATGPEVPPSKGRASAVFGAVTADGPKKPGAEGRIARPNTARVLPAVPDPATAGPAPVASTTPGAAADTPGVGAVADAIPAAGTRGAQIVAIAKAELDRGVAEEPSGSNNSERIAEYRTATEGSGVGPWCAYFTSWVAKQAGVPVGENGSGIGYVPTLKNWAEQTDRYIPNGSGPPQVGDLVVFDWQGDGVLDHVGIVSGVRPDGGIETIEGNAGDKIATRSYGSDGYAGLVRLAKPGEPALATPGVVPQDPALAGPLKAVPDPAAATPGAVQAEVQPKAKPSAGRASAVFGAVSADGAQTPGAAQTPVSATPPAQPAPSATPGADAAADAAASLPADDAALAAQLDAWMARKNPGAPLQGYGAVFVREGRANGVDPRLLVAIARAESSLGSDPGAISINNAFGWGPHKPFPTWDENIATVAKGLRTGYIDDGLDTINEIQKRYCPVGAANDPTGVNSNWLGNVRLLYAELGGDPDGSVALAPSGQVGPPAVEPLVAQPQVLASPVQVQSAVTPPATGPEVPPSKGRASAVFGAVTADGPKKPGAEGRIARPNTARVLPAVPDPATAGPAPVASTTPGAAADTPGVGAVADAIPAAGTRGAQIVAIAKAELDRGVAEEPSGSNNSERIAEYRTATEGSGVGPWCAYFTSWVAKQAGVPVGENGSGIGYVPTLKNWAEQTDRYIPNGSGPPQVGDLVVFDWQGDGVLDHVGIVSGVRPDGGIETIEGNAGDKIATRSYGSDGYAGLVRLAKPGEPALATPGVVPQDPALAGPLKAVPDPAAATPGAVQAEVQPKAKPSAGRASAVFGAVSADGAQTPGAAQTPVSATPPAQPAPSATPGADAAADAAASLPADDAALAAQLDAWMARKNPGAPLQGYGAVFVREGRANGVDPRLLVAIARAESSLGSDPGAISINNAFGWGPHKPFPTWDENIATVAKGLRTGYIDDGLDTINEIQKRYCPVGAANDPTGVNSNWLGNVRLLYAELGGDPDGSVALAPSGQVGPPAVEPLVAQPQVLASPVQAEVQPKAKPSAGRASAVFGAVSADGAQTPGAAQTPAAQTPVSATPGAAADTPGVGAVADAIPAAGTRGAQIVAIAKAELDRGVAEEPSGSNNSERIAEYRTATEGSGVGPWCAYFTSWVAKQAGVPVGENGSGIGYVPTLKNWAEQTDRYIPNGSGPPQVGDLVVFDWQGDGVLDHVGIVSGVRPDGGIETIEGNAGDKIATRSYGSDGYAGLVRLAKPGEPALATPGVVPQDPALAGPLKAVPDPAAATPGAVQAEVQPKAKPSAGRASAVFGAVSADGAQTPGAAPVDDGRIARPNTARVLPAVPDPATADPAPVASVTPASTTPPPVAAEQAPPASAAVAGVVDAYPGDNAPKEQIAMWMARTAQAAGLPPELPVMAGLVESGLSNLDHGHADSLGFFQMRESVWNTGDYAGYADKPELQLKWFLDQATAIKKKRLDEGLTTFGTNPAAFGEWIADVERPAEQYRGRYQLRLSEARALIFGVPGTR